MKLERVRLNLTLPADVASLLEEKAAENYKTKSQFISDLILRTATGEHTDFPKYSTESPMKGRVRLNLSITTEIARQLKLFAAENYRSNISRAVSSLILQA